MTERTLFFLHIPRTGGTSLIEYLDRKMSGAGVCPAHEMFEFEKLHREGRLDGFGFYRGHFGINLLDQVAPHEGRLITLMRSPPPLIFSLWRHMGRARPPFPRDLSPSALRAHRMFEAARDMSFRKCCEWIMDQGWRSVFNQMTVLLGVGRGFGIPDEEPDLNESVLERAKRTVDRFSFVGFTEALDLSVRSLQRQFGWEIEPIGHTNAGPISPFPEDAGLIDWLSKAAEFDIELYNYAASRFPGARTAGASTLKITIDADMERAVAADTAPRLLYSYKGYNIVSVKGSYVAAAWDLGPLDTSAVLANAAPRPPVDKFMIAHATPELEARIDAYIASHVSVHNEVADEHIMRMKALEATMEERTRRLTALEASLEERTQRLTALEATVAKHVRVLSVASREPESRSSFGGRLRSAIFRWIRWGKRDH